MIINGKSESISVPPELFQHICRIESIPNPFCYKRNRVRAFVLGADPSNFSGPGETTIFFQTVFGLGEGDARYFSRILSNLKETGLSLEDVYVQNLVRNYLLFETSKNPKIWGRFAEHWLPLLKEELDSVDPSRKVPVLVTAEIIFRFLHPSLKKVRAREIYTSKRKDILQQQLGSDDNRLIRPVIPFYRHISYRLTNEEFDPYKNFIRSLTMKKLK